MLRLRYGQHIPVECELADTIRRHLHDDEWMVYRHVKNQKWVAARWLSRWQHLVYREFVIGPRLVGLSPDVLETLRWQNSPAIWQEKHEALQALLMADKADEDAIGNQWAEWKQDTDRAVHDAGHRVKASPLWADWKAAG